ncbi:DUF1947 domain-containing protein [Candidatus Woesearchaeota archaeon]|nr:DUF1947 domain-containing protein [Candidatus Woesearchaeota archaeon]
MKRTQISYKDIEHQLQEYKIEISKKDHLELLNDKVLLINHIPTYFLHEGKYIPTLKYLQQHQALKKITVDMGAVKFVVGGADIMRPGIVEIESEIKKDEAVVIIDINNKKPLAIGIALYSSAEMQEMKTGKVIKNIHYVGDEVWKAGM